MRLLLPVSREAVPTAPTAYVDGHHHSDGAREVAWDAYMGYQSNKLHKGLFPGMSSPTWSGIGFEP